MSNNILIFGSNGFISRSFIESKHKMFDNIFCIDVAKNTMLNKYSNVQYYDCSLISFEKIKEKIKEKIQDEIIDFAISFAWRATSGPERDNWDVQYSNVTNGIERLELCASLKIKKYVSMGSIMENELFLDVQNENIQSNKLYALAKYNDHVLSSIFCKKNNIDFISVIVTNTYGVGEESPRLINTIIDKFIDNQSMQFSKCNQLYSFIYIDDLVNILYILLSKGEPNYRYVIGDLECKSLKSYIERLYACLNKFAKKNILPGFSDIEQTSLSIDDLNTVDTFFKTSYEMSVSFEEGVIKTYEWKNKGK